MESFRSKDYIYDQISTHRFSRHFRNHLFALHGEELRRFRDAVKSHAPEIALVGEDDDPITNDNLDVFYTESDNFEKELCWIGDGMQIWLQVMFQLNRLADRDCVVFDEHVYLHPDLQRRLINLLEDASYQSVLATHAAEVVAEAPQQSVVWVDRLRNRAVSSPAGVGLSAMASSLGTLFNMRLARALRAKVILFVEGDDMKLLSTLAKLVGATRLAQERGVAVVPLGGGSNWRRLDGFRWVANEMLSDAIKGFVVLDRDLHSDQYAEDTRAALASAGLRSHFWLRHELESYLLVPDALGRITGEGAADARSRLIEAADSLRQQCLIDAISTISDEQGRNKRHVSQITSEAQALVDSFWEDPEERLARCPAKELLSVFNQRRQSEGGAPVTQRRLAAELRAGEVAEDLAEVLMRIEAMTRD